MKITVLGTGTSQGIPVIGCNCDVCVSSDPKDNRLRCSILVEVDGMSILIDTSPDLRQQMLSNEVERVDAILYTHEHNDHVVGLDDIRPYNFMQGGEMPIYGLSRVMKDLHSRFGYAFTKGAYPGAPRVASYDIDGIEEIDVKGVNVTPIPVWHGKLPILGYRIGDFAYLTDISKVDKASMKKLEGLQVLMIDALRQHPEHHSHLTLNQAVELVDQLQPRAAFLTHVSHMMGRTEVWEKTLPDNVRSAFDGQEIIL